MKKVAQWAYHFVRLLSSPEINLSLLYLHAHGRWPDLKNPKTYNEKIQHRKLHDRNPLLPVLIDKLRVKEYVRKKLGDAWVTPTLWAGKKLPSPSQRNWQVPFVIKANHGCGWNIFVQEPVSDWARIEKACDTWVNTHYAPKQLEWAYGKIDPCILIEPFIGALASAPCDYKFHVFSGRVEYIQVVTNLNTAKKIRFYDRDWSPQDVVCHGVPVEEREISRPPHFSELMAASEELGAGFPYVRVDLYDADKPLFGELTFYPCSGIRGFSPRSWDLKLGDLWVDISYPQGT